MFLLGLSTVYETWENDLTFMLSLIFREVFQLQLLCIHNVNCVYLIFSFLIENLLYNSMSAGGRSHTLAAIHLFAQGL